MARRYVENSVPSFVKLVLYCLLAAALIIVFLQILGGASSNTNPRVTPSTVGQP